MKLVTALSTKNILPRARRERSRDSDRDRGLRGCVVLSGSAVWLWTGKNLVWTPIFMPWSWDKPNIVISPRPKGGLRYAPTAQPALGVFRTQKIPPPLSLSCTRRLACGPVVPRKQSLFPVQSQSSPGCFGWCSVLLIHTAFGWESRFTTTVQSSW